MPDEPNPQAAAAPASPSAQSSSPSAAAPQSPAPAAQPAAASSPAAPSAKAEKPAELPDTLWDADKGSIRYDSLNEILAARAADEVRKQSLPQSADEYKLELPPDFKLPEGFGEWQWKEGDPLLAQARAMAHEMGLPQEHFSKLLGLYAASQVGDAAAIKQAHAAEVAKLGPNATARVSAVQQWLRATLGDELGRMIGGDDKSMGRLFTAQDVTAFEKLISKVSSSGPGFTNRGREQPEQGRIDGYDKMTFEQRRAAQDRLKAVPSAAR